MSIPIKNLKNLARLYLSDDQEKQLENDLNKIIDYFNELTKLNTDKVEPLSGGVDIVNKFRQDNKNLFDNLLLEQMPNKENGFLKIPDVFK
ncbi:MAG: Asp-tRNA(Asn)/Glu-tRNA(Gln) amidotransferase subunit GatC [Minisyncoccia bacterium]